MEIKKTYAYDDVLLIPQYSDITSRSEINIDTDLGKGVKLSLPIIASPMDTVSEYFMAKAMHKAGACAIIHRYNDIETQAAHVQKTIKKNKSAIVGAAIGITDDYMQRAKSMYEAGASFICVDVAHGHHLLMKQALKELRYLVGDDYHIMAGNVATLEGVNDLADWGADSVRCNIGGGSICSTRVQTGHGIPGLQTIMECSQTDRDVKIIADGGIKNSGDMVKALAAGADAVMCGSLLAGATESPGELFYEKGLRWKVYRGMASKEAQLNWRGRYSSFEGVSSRVPYSGPVENILNDIEKGIRSGFSYSGSRSLLELQAKAKFIEQTTSGLAESKTHISTRTW